MLKFDPSPLISRDDTSAISISNRLADVDISPNPNPFNFWTVEYEYDQLWWPSG